MIVSLVAMTANVRTTLLVVAALVAAGAAFRQQSELHRLRTAVAELANLRSDQGTPVSTVPNPLPSDTEELRREPGEIQRLRAELTQLRREKVEMSALQASIEKLAAEVVAIRKIVNAGSGPIVDSPASGSSPLVSRAASLAQSHPAEAARLVTELPAGEEQNQAALAVIDRWISSDPLAAAAWTSQFPDGPLREQAMSLVARQWGLRDWNATAAWLETLPVGSSRDAAIGAFVTSADGYDIQLALEWANRMEDPENRAQRVEWTARRWLRDDSPAARAWIEKAPLPAGMAERLLAEK